MAYIVGIDVGGTTVKLGIFPMDGDPVCKWEIVTRKMEELQYFWGDVADAVKGKFAELGIDYSELKAAGIGLPGPIREDGFLAKCVNLGMGACYPGQILSELLGVPVAAGNDANVAALGEAAYGAGKGSESSATFTLGTGVGGGIVVKNRILAGNRGLCGEVGHFCVNPDETDKCNCGSTGCLEQYASATGIVRMANKALAASNKASGLRAVEKFSAKDVCDYARQGDELAAETIDTFGKYLAMAISHVMLTTDPDVIILGGGVSRAGQVLLDAVDKYIKKYVHITEDPVPVKLATLGNDGGIYGAAALAKTCVE